MTVESLAGTTAPQAWTDETTVLLGAGRTRPDAGQQAQAPQFTQAMPVLG